MVKESSMRYGSVFFHISTSAFNDFIDNLGVVDVPMTGKRFTRIDAIGARLSKLDRF